MTQQLRRLAGAALFRSFITTVILAAGVLVGVETDPGVVARHGELLHVLHRVVLGIFIVEIAIRLGAEGARPWRFFQDGWNVFDFLIVAGCLVPFGSSSVTALRMLRLLRVVRLVHVLPKLRLRANALLKSMPSMFYVTLLLSLLFYVYAVAAVFLFGDNDPHHFGTLDVALLSLFRVVTLDGWTDILYTQMFGCDVYAFPGAETTCTAPSTQPGVAVAFFVSFVLLGTMSLLDLFIGVILASMQAARRDSEAGDGRPGATQVLPISARLVALQSSVAALQSSVSALLADEAASAGRRGADEPTRSAIASAPVPAAQGGEVEPVQTPFTERDDTHSRR